MSDQEKMREEFSAWQQTDEAHKLVQSMTTAGFEYAIWQASRAQADAAHKEDIARMDAAGEAACAIANERGEQLAAAQLCIEQMRRQVAMLVGWITEWRKDHLSDSQLCGALDNLSQATAEAYERELAAKVLEKFKHQHPTDSNGCFIHSSCLDKAIAELRAANEKKEG